METTTEQVPVEKTFTPEGGQSKIIPYGVIGFFAIIAIFVCYIILNLDKYVAKAVPDEIASILVVYNEKLQSGDMNGLNTLASTEDKDFLKDFEAVNKQVSTAITDNKVKLGKPVVIGLSRKIESSEKVNSDIVEVSLQSKFVGTSVDVFTDNGESFPYFNQSFSFIKTKEGYKIEAIKMSPSNKEFTINSMENIVLATWLAIVVLFLATAIFYVKKGSTIKTYWLFIIFLVPWGIIAFWIIRPYRNLP